MHDIIQYGDTNPLHMIPVKNETAKNITFIFILYNFLYCRLQYIPGVALYEVRY